MNTTYTTTIGLEVHAELRTQSKMFCGCRNDPHDSEPNANICPVCLAHPGTLPVPNKEAIAKVLLFGEAVNAKRATYSEFDRKNYFYPDIPKAYQISQYAFPFLTGGTLAGVALTRVHLEEDTARNQHEGEGVSLVDFNRSGVPLMELVTEPVIHNAKTACHFARELQLLLQTLGISDAEMSRGEMRVEANISVSKTDKLGTKVEVKNLNSFRSVESAIDYEIKRQQETLDSGGEVKQETRGWDELKQKTFIQRSKETAKDYRYFPDPDIPKIDISSEPYFSKKRLEEILPELPTAKREKYEKIGLTVNQIQVILSDKRIDKAFSELYKRFSSNSQILKLSANYLTSDAVPLLSQDPSKDITVDSFSELMLLILDSKINSRVAKDLLTEILFSNISPKDIATERGLIQSQDVSAVIGIIQEVIIENKSIVEEYLAGKEPALQYLLGQAMKKSRGSANPNLLKDIFKSELSKNK